MGARENQVNKIELVESSPEKAGVGGSIPSLATNTTLVFSAFSRLFFCLCQFCAMDCSYESVLTALVFRRPLRIVTADHRRCIRKGSLRPCRGRRLPGMPCWFRCERVRLGVTMGTWKVTRRRNRYEYEQKRNHRQA
jgi:hypothetical protein